jgi:hypothetical protein
MSRFRVKTLSVSGIGNKIHYAGDVVTAKNFPEGNIDKLVEEGYVVPYDGEDDAQEGSSSENDANSSDKKSEEGEDAKTKSFVNSKGETKVATTIKDISRTELLKELNDATAKFDVASTKEVLFDLWMSL